MGVTAVTALLIALVGFAIVATPALAVTTIDDAYIVPAQGTSVAKNNPVEAYAVDDAHPIVAASMTIDGFAVSTLSLQYLDTQTLLISY